MFPHIRSVMFCHFELHMVEAETEQRAFRRANTGIWRCKLVSVYVGLWGCSYMSFYKQVLDWVVVTDLLGWNEN
jgi:hypothetical protein